MIDRNKNVNKKWCIFLYDYINQNIVKKIFKKQNKTINYLVFKLKWQLRSVKNLCYGLINKVHVTVAAIAISSYNRPVRLLQNQGPSGDTRTNLAQRDICRRTCSIPNTCTCSCSIAGYSWGSWLCSTGRTKYHIHYFRQTHQPLYMTSIGRRCRISPFHRGTLWL